MSEHGLKERLRGWGAKRWAFVVLQVVLALGCGACLVGFWFVSHALETTTAAQRFRGESETRFAQMACFLPVGQGKTEEQIFEFRSGLDTKFVEQSLEAPEGGSLYVDAYSGTASVSLSTDHGSATVEATGVGGDFFYFHPLQLRSGAYISQSDLMDDLVVLDELLAWRLFGGIDLTGMTLYINGVPFVVSGVVSLEEDFATNRAYTQEGGLFMSYSALGKLDETLSVSCYEIVLPDPISGYARSIVETGFPPEVGDTVENSSRYTIGHLLEVIGSFGERSMRTNGVIYPYWENALRLTEDYSALLLVLAVLFGLCPVISAVAVAILGVRRGYRHAREAIPAKVEAAVERRREKQYGEFLEEEAKGEETWPS